MCAQDSWQEQKLGKYAYIKGRIGWRGLKASEYTKGGPYLIAGNHIANGKVNWSDCDHISLHRYKESLEIALKEKDIILTKDGTIGRIAFINKLPGLATINSTMMLVRVNNKFSPKFVYHYLTGERFQRLVNDKVSGSSIPHIFQRDMVELSIPIPLLEEQQKIAEILDTVDRAIALTQTHITKLKKAKAGLLHDLLTRGIDEHGELRDPTRNPEQFKDSPLGRIPKDWEVKTCESLCKEIVVGIVIRPAQYYQSSGVPVLRSANIRESGINASDLVFMSEKSNQMLSKSMITVGDILTVRTGYPGTSCVVSQKWDSCNCVDLIISRPSCEIYSYFLALWINSDFGKGQVIRGQGGLAQQHFNVGELQKLLVVKPSIDEQQKITAIFFNYNTRIQKKETRLEKLKLLKKGLMSDLLTGKVRVKI